MQIYDGYSMLLLYLCGDRLLKNMELLLVICSIWHGFLWVRTIDVGLTATIALQCADSGGFGDCPDRCRVVLIGERPTRSSPVHKKSQIIIPVYDGTWLWKIGFCRYPLSVYNIYINTCVYIYINYKLYIDT